MSQVSPFQHLHWLQLDHEIHAFFQEVVMFEAKQFQ